MTKQSKSKPVPKTPTRPTRKLEEQKPKASRAKRDTLKNQPAPRREPKTVARFDWQGVTVAVSYEADWMGMSKELSQFATAHLEIEAVEPPRQALPVTETGYRSHFIAKGIIEQAGGPVAYARAWLDHAARAPEWKRREQQSRQLCLF
jgi:hypothetical protein